MAGVPPHDVSDVARDAWLSVRDDLRRILGDDLVAVWAHGGTISGTNPAGTGDLDTHVLLARRPDGATARSIEDAADAVARDRDVELDTWFVLADDAARADPPRHAWREGKRDTAWALHRAHWLAGRYVNLHGPEPAEIVKPPSWKELQTELDRELEHIERHVVEGDTDVHEATYAILNGSRILYAIENRSVVITKRAAGIWALKHLPARWHTALQAAERSYEGQATADDPGLLAAEMAPFVTFVRERMPPTGDRPAGALPPWSGY